MIIKVTKLGFVDNPLNNDSTFGESSEYHLRYFIKKPIVGESFKLDPFSDKHREQGIITTKVTKIIDENTFYTKNSIYRWEKYI